jgi:hypothetical protein
VRQFVEALETMHPGVVATLESGGDLKGDWWLDVGHRKGHFTVHWDPQKGFGLHAQTDEAVYGESPSERFRDTAMLLRRVEQVLDEGELGSLMLKDLRELQGLSQMELGERLGIQQAAVSKVERRQDLHLDTLVAIVKALGGVLEMKVKFPGGEVPLKIAR